MFLKTVLFVAIVHQSIAFRIKAEGCDLDFSVLDPEPIAVQSLTRPEFLYPKPGSQSVSLAIGQSLVIACPGGVINVGPTSRSFITATCVSAQKLAVDGTPISFNAIFCSKNPFNTARYTNQSCEQNGKEVEIGFILDDSTFVRQIQLCFDSVGQNTLYSYYNLTGAIGAHESGVSRPSFIEDDFYNVGANGVNELYERANQRKTINALVGLPASSTKYIQNTNDYFLARGHLTAKADFIYAAQQRATFHYINVAPQWQTFNGQNWNSIETQVRDYADLKSLDLRVYTGTYGVATLPHEDTKQDVPLYLYVDGESNGLPVPELYWKVVYEPETKLGVALVGINNPYKEDVSSSVVCEDISEDISWMEWNRTIESGYIYACAVDDLRKSVPHLPSLEVTGVLA